MDSRKGKKHRSYAEPPIGSNAAALERPHLQDRAHSASVLTSSRQSNSKSQESSKQSSPTDRDSRGLRRDDPAFSSYQSSRPTESEKLRASAKSREDVGILPLSQPCPPPKTDLALVCHHYLFRTDADIACRLGPTGSCPRSTWLFWELRKLESRLLCNVLSTSSSPH